MSRRLRVLHLEDRAADAAIIRDRLELDGVACDIRLTQGKADFESALAQEPFDLVISDYNLPGYDGIAALKYAQASQPDVPVILVSGTVSEEEAVKCLQFGATDYLIKSRLDRLAPAVRRAIEEAETRLTRRRAEVALTQSEQRKAAILDSVLECIVTMDAEGAVIEFNTAAERTFGYTKAQAIGQPLAELIIPVAARAAHRAGMARYLTSGVGPVLGKVIEVTAMRADGSELPVELTITAIPSEKAPIFTGVMRDITGRKHADENRARLAAIVDSSDDAIVSMGLDGTILTWNAGAERVYGYLAGEIIGRNRAILLAPGGEVGELQLMMDKAARGEAGKPFEMRRMRKNGSPVDLSVTLSPMTDSGGRVTSVSAIARDITDRRALEAQYHQAQKMEAIGQLAGGVAHDFNNLLTVILGYCELLLDDADTSGKCRTDVAQIQKAGVSAAALTRQLLAFSRKEIISPTLLDLNVVLAGMRALLNRLIREDVEIVIRLRPEPAPVMADRGQLEQIVLNLVVNARDAMPGGGTLTIAVTNVDLAPIYAQNHLGVIAGPYVELAVTDTGTGMTPDVKARLFEPFFTTKDASSGTGLGLATVHGIVTQNRGNIDVDSVLGQGTTFRVYLPRETKVPQVAEVPAPVRRAHAGGETVVVVEDAEGLRSLITILLQRLGYKVLGAANAEQAFRLFDQGVDIHLLLTDVVMPGGNGPELAKRLVSIRPALKVIYMSGYTDDAIVHHGVLDSGIAFLHKPFTADALGRKIREVLDQ